MDNEGGHTRKRKQKTLTLAEKICIIEDFENGKGTHASLAWKYGVGASSVTRFLQQKEEIREKFERYREHGVENRKTLKKQFFPLMEESLYVWVLQQREANIIVTSEALQVKGDQLFREIQKRGYYVEQNCSFSEGWMRRFKDRFGLHVKRVAGEKASADTASYLKFKDVLEEQILEMGLKKSQVYNADESAIFIKMLASRSVVLSHESKASGRKLNKMRYTFMPCSNVDGSNKLKLMFIGTAAKPRSFPAKELLPVSYYNSKKAWMTRELFRTWFYNEFIPAVREFSERFNLEPKALLVLDNCTAHYDGGDKLISDDGLIKVIYLPPNVTSECQPMDQAVINAIKMRYKRKLMLKLVLEDEQLKFEDRLKKITLQQSIDWLSAAWDEISSSTIENSWKKLINQFPECDWSSADLDVPDNVDDIPALVVAVDALAGTSTSEDEIKTWIADRFYDDEHNPAWLTSVVFSDKEIVDAVLGAQLNDGADDTSKDESTDTSMDASFTKAAQESDFNLAIQSVDYLINYVQPDAGEICHLKLLRTKLIETEWRKRML